MTPVKRRHKFCTFASLTIKHVPNTFVFKQLASLCKLEELAMKSEQTQISRKLAQVTASHRKLAVKRDTSVHKLKTCDDLRSRVIRA